jgi:hypothetical protein
VYREYLEELFSREEVKTSRSVISYDYFYGDRNLAYLRSLIESGSARLYFTGLAVNLLTLRVDICTLLHIRDYDWFANHKGGTRDLDRIELNDEWKPPPARTKTGTYVWPVDELERYDLNLANTAPFTAAGIALGLRLARNENLIRP